MTGRDESVQHDDRASWQGRGEGYPRALLEQGSIDAAQALPAEVHEVMCQPIRDPEAWAAPGPPLEPSEGAPGEMWESARAALEERTSLCLQVVGANRGGLVVEWNGMPGFVPASRLKENPHTRLPQERARLLSRRIGESVQVRLIEVDEDQHRLVFSERAAAEVGDPSRALLDKLRPGDVRRGTVVNMASFGAFVDLGGIEGLLHVSEISWDRLGHPADLLHMGDEVQVQVVGVNPDEERVALSMKRLRPNPWSDSHSRYRAGQIVEGDVTSVVSFGAFVRLEEGLEGLIHASELPEGNAARSREVVCEGSRVRARVIAVDAEKHRVALSLRQVHEAEPIA